MNNEHENATERNIRRLQGAIDRLLAGRPEASDGKLTLKSLSDESGVPRPYLYRAEYRHVAADFEFRVRQAGQSVDPGDNRAAELAELRRRLAEQEGRSSARLRELQAAQSDLRKAASQIMFLSEQNRALREELEAARRVVPINTVRS